jgi:hypothetical protein
MKKLLSLILLILSFKANAYIQRFPQVEMVNSTDGYSFKAQEDQFSLLRNIEHNPGVITLIFDLPDGKGRYHSVKVPRGPGSFDNISTIGEYGRHNVQWKTEFEGDQFVKMTITGKKGTILKLHNWILQSRSLRPYFEDKLSLGSIENLIYSPSNNSSFLGKLRTLKTKYNCPDAYTKKTICSDIPKLPYLKTDACWNQVPESEWQELFKEERIEASENVNYISDSFCLEKAPFMSLEKGLALGAIQQLKISNQLSEIFIPVHVWRHYEITL